MPPARLVGLPLLLVPSLLQAQIRLERAAVTKVAAIAATVTIPALNFRGDLGGVIVNLGYSRVNTAGYYLDLSGPSSNSLPSSVTVGGSSYLPAGNYSVRFDFVNLPSPMQFEFTGNSSTPIGNCSLTAGPGYATVQTCQLTFSFPGGHVLASIQPTSGNVATLKQVTVTRYQ